MSSGLVDLATLGITIDSSDAVTADTNLSKLTATAARLETAVTTMLKAWLGWTTIKHIIIESAQLNARFETMGIVMEVAGRNAGYSARQMHEYELQLRKTGIAMIEARETLTRMSQAQLDLSKTSQLARVAQDAAVVGAINSSEAFSRLVYGIQSAQTEVLRSIGINVDFQQSYQKLAKELGTTVDHLTTTQKTTARMNAVLEEGAKIAGIYESAMGTAGKQMQSMKRYVDDLKVTFGQTFNEGLTMLVFGVSNALKSVGKEATDLANNGSLTEWGRGALQVLAYVAESLNMIALVARRVGQDFAHMRAASDIRDKYSKLEEQIPGDADFSNARRRSDLIKARDAELAALNRLRDETVKSEKERAGAMLRGYDEYMAARDKQRKWEVDKEKNYAADLITVQRAYAKESKAVQKEAEDSLKRFYGMPTKAPGVSDSSTNLKTAAASNAAATAEAMRNLTERTADYVAEARRQAGLDEQLSSIQLRMISIAGELADNKGKLTEKQRAALSGSLQELALIDTRMKAEAAASQQRETDLEVYQHEHNTWLQIEAEREEAIDAYISKLNEKAWAESDYKDAAESVVVGIEKQTKAILANKDALELESAMLQVNQASAKLSDEQRSQYTARVTQAILDLRAARAVQAEVEQTAGVFKSLEAAAQSAWNNIESGGVGTFRRVGEALKSLVWDLLYQMTLKKWVVSIAASISPVAASSAFGSQVAAGASGSAAGSVIGGATSSLLNGGAAFSLAGISQGFSLAASNIGAAGYFGGLGSTAGLVGSSLSAGSFGTAVGAAAPYLLPLLAVSALLKGKKPSDKTASGSIDFDTGGTETWSMTDKKYSAANNEARDAMLATTQSFASLLSAMGGTLSGDLKLSTGDRDGMRADFGADGVREIVERDSDKFFGALFDAMTDRAEGLDQNLKLLIQTFEGTAEETLTYAATLAGIKSQLVPALDAIGLSLGVFQKYSNGVDLVEIAGGFDVLMGSVSGYYQAFYTEEEQLDRALTDMSTTISKLNLTVPETKDEFRALVESLDLTTAAGREAFVSLTQLAPAYAQAIDMQAQLAQQALQAAEQVRQQRLVDGDVSSARSSVTSAIAAIGETLENSMTSASDAISAVASSVNALASAGSSIRSWLVSMRAASDAFSDKERFAAARNQYLSTMSAAASGDVTASNRVTTDADTYIAALRDTAQSTNEYKYQVAAVLAAVSNLPATNTWEEQVVQELQNINAGVKQWDLNTDNIRLQMIVQAQSEIEKVIKLIGDTTNLPRDVKELALATSGTIYRTIAAIVDASWDEKTYQLGFGATTDLSRVLTAVVSSSWSAEAKELAFGTSSNLSRTLSAIVDASWAPTTRQLAFGTTTDISRVLTAIVGSSWDAETTQLAFGYTTDLVRALDAVVSSGWSEEAKMLAFGYVQDATRQLALNLTSTSGADLNTALAAMFAPSSTIQKVIQIITQGDVAALVGLGSGTSTPAQIAEQAAAAAAAQQAAAAVVAQQTAANLAAQQAAEQAAAAVAAQQAAAAVALDSARDAWFADWSQTNWGDYGYITSWQQYVSLFGEGMARVMGVPGFAEGGSYGGGLALVGERGPELINFNQPGQVYTAEQTSSMLGGSALIVEEVRALRAEVVGLRAEVRADVGHNSKVAKLLERAMPDGDALATRDADAVNAPPPEVPM